MDSRKRYVRCCPSFSFVKTDSKWKDFSVYVVDDDIKAAKECVSLILNVMIAIKNINKDNSPEDVYKALRKALPDFAYFDFNDSVDREAFEAEDNPKQKMILVNLFDSSNPILDDNEYYDQTFYLDPEKCVNVLSLLSHLFVKVDEDTSKLAPLPPEFLEKYTWDEADKLLEIFNRHSDEGNWFIPFNKSLKIKPSELPKKLKDEYIAVITKLELNRKGYPCSNIDSSYEVFLEEASDVLNDNKISEEKYNELLDIVEKALQESGYTN